MRPGPSPPRPAQPVTHSTPRARRRPDLTLPLPDRPTSLPFPLPLADGPTSLPSVPVPLPLPPPPDPTTTTTNTTSSSVPSSPSLSDLSRIRRLGSGAGGTVWLVLHRPSNHPFALKILHGHHDDQFLTQIKREISILRHSHNPFIVPCLALYDHHGEIHLLLEFMDGGSLESRHIPHEPDLADIARQVLSGLAYLHRRKIVHRDIKPSNLLINSSNRVKIADFGVSRILAQTMDPCNSSVGTIAYMSPERINTDLNGGVYDGYAGDIWSFGLSMLEFYLGKFPFGENVGRQGDWASLMCSICYADPPEAPESCSREFRNFIACCLKKNPAERLTALQLLQHPFITNNTSSLNSV